VKLSPRKCDCNDFFTKKAEVSGRRRPMGAGPLPGNKAAPRGSVGIGQSDKTCHTRGWSLQGLLGLVSFGKEQGIPLFRSVREIAPGSETCQKRIRTCQNPPCASPAAGRESPEPLKKSGPARYSGTYSPSGRAGDVTGSCQEHFPGASQCRGVSWASRSNTARRRPEQKGPENLSGPLRSYHNGIGGGRGAAGQGDCGRTAGTRTEKVGVRAGLKVGDRPPASVTILCCHLAKCRGPNRTAS
jgi:hypothetical protein